VDIPVIAEPQPVKGLEAPRVPDQTTVLPVDQVVLHDVPPQAVDSLADKQSPSVPSTQAETEQITPKLDADGIPVAWILQVASMSQREKADDLQRELVALGYKSNVKVIKRGNQRLYRVTVGPKFDKNRMREIKQVIDKRYKVDAIVARYLP
jgi:DedD protein